VGLAGAAAGVHARAGPILEKYDMQIVAPPEAGEFVQIVQPPAVQS
jgi:hypothetical protein